MLYVMCCCAAAAISDQLMDLYTHIKVKSEGEEPSGASLSELGTDGLPTPPHGAPWVHVAWRMR